MQHNLYNQVIYGFGMLQPLFQFAQPSKLTATPEIDPFFMFFFKFQTAVTRCTMVLLLLK